MRAGPDVPAGGVRWLLAADRPPSRVSPPEGMAGTDPSTEPYERPSNVQIHGRANASSRATTATPARTKSNSNRSAHMA